MKKIILIVLLGMISISAFSYGQDTLAISKAELLQKISDKNLQLKIADVNQNWFWFTAFIGVDLIQSRFSKWSLLETI